MTRLFLTVTVGFIALTATVSRIVDTEVIEAQRGYDENRREFDKLKSEFQQLEARAQKVIHVDSPKN